MVKLTTSIFIFISILTFAQTNWQKGYDKGYSEGYCYNDIGCVSLPAPPSIQKVGDDYNSYKDGYNKGFSEGQKAKSEKNFKTESQTRERYKTAKPEFIDDFVYNPYKDPNYVNLVIKVAELKSQKLNNLFDSGLNYYKSKKFENAIYNADEMLKIDNTISQAYALKSISQYQLGELLNSFNNMTKAQSLNYSEIEVIKSIYEPVKKHLKELMANENYKEVIDFCINSNYDGDITHYYLARAYYYKNDLKNAIKYFKKYKIKSSEIYLKSIKDDIFLPNPFKEQKDFITEIYSNYNSDDLNAKIEKLFKEKNYTEILERLKPLENYIDNNTLNDNNPKIFLYNYKSYCNYYLKNWEDCISDATNYINSTTELDYRIYYFRAVSKQQINDLSGCINDYDYLINNDFRDKKFLSIYYNNRGLSKINLKNVKEGCIDLHKAYELGLSESKIQIEKYCN